MESSSAESASGALRARVTAELNGANPWRAARLADEWAALPGLSDAERADALVEGARARAQVGDYAGAQAKLEAALKARPGDADASYLLAEATRDSPERALAFAEAAAGAAGPARRRAAAYRLAAQIRIDLGDEAEARKDLSRALDLAKDDLDALVLMSSLRREEPAAALKFARAACAAADAQPSWRRAAAERLCARALSDLQDYSGAMSALGRALALGVDDSDTLRALLRVKQLSPAQKLPKPAALARDKTMTAVQARAALASDPDDLEALRILFEAARAAGRRDEAAKLADDFTSGVLRCPNWQRLDAYRQSARQWTELGEVKTALASLTRAEDLDATSVPTEKLVGEASRRYIAPAVAEAYEAAMRLRLALGDPAGADATLERGLQLVPDNFQLLRLLIDRKLEESNPKAALPYAQRMLETATKAAPPAFWNPEKQGLLSDEDRAKQGDLMLARETMAKVRTALATP